jgi:HPt (histidine-containing phosphotransfer) domain-containing protein
MENKLYDLSKLEKVCGGDEAFMNSMIQIFIKTLPESIASIHGALSVNDYETISKQAHKIKPSVNYICISSIYNGCIEVELWEDSEETMIQKTELLIQQLTIVLDQLNSL